MSSKNTPSIEGRCAACGTALWLRGKGGCDVCKAMFAAPAPTTERIPWQQSIGRTLPDGKEIIGADKAPVRPRVKFGNARNATYRFADADGTVEVLIEDAE